MTPTSRLTTSTVAARIPYANAAPFYALWADAPFAVRNPPPRDLGREAEAGGVDRGLMAVGDFLRLRDRFELLAPMGVAARGAVQSVLLFSRRPVSSLAAGLANLPEVARAQTEPGWTPEETEGYLRRFHYRLGAEDLEGMSRFEALLTERGWIHRD